MKIVKAKIAVHGVVDLTNDKEYEVISLGKDKDYGSGFYIEVKDDKNMILKYDSSHFNISNLECINNIIKDQVNHPQHYGGKENVYETIKVIEAWKCNFNIGQVVNMLVVQVKKKV